MEDIANAAGMSGPAVYQYVRNKSDVFRRLAARIFNEALGRASVVSAGEGTLAQRLDRILAIKVGVVQRLFHPSPHAPGLVGENAGVASDLNGSFVASGKDLLAATITDGTTLADLALRHTYAREIAELVLALARGLEADLSDPDRTRARLATASRCSSRVSPRRRGRRRGEAAPRQAWPATGRTPRLAACYAACSAESVDLSAPPRLSSQACVSRFHS